MAGFPGLSANPVENEEQGKLNFSPIYFQVLDTKKQEVFTFIYLNLFVDIMMRSEENQKWGCVVWGAFCWGKSTDFSPACHECMSLCDATTCAKKPEVPH
jgi:hypothetical protein